MEGRGAWLVCWLFMEEFPSELCKGIMRPITSSLTLSPWRFLYQIPFCNANLLFGWDVSCRCLLKSLFVRRNLGVLISSWVSLSALVTSSNPSLQRPAWLTAGLGNSPRGFISILSPGHALNTERNGGIRLHQCLHPPESHVVGMMESGCKVVLSLLRFAELSRQKLLMPRRWFYSSHTFTVQVFPFFLSLFFPHITVFTCT